MANYTFDPSWLLHVDWMSDEDSGPENIEDLRGDDQEDAVQNWREDMLERLGFKDLQDDDHDDVAILEVVHPEWRSKYVGGRKLSI